MTGNGFTEPLSEIWAGSVDQQWVKEDCILCFFFLKKKREIGGGGHGDQLI